MPAILCLGSTPLGSMNCHSSSTSLVNLPQVVSDILGKDTPQRVIPYLSNPCLKGNHLHASVGGHARMQDAEAKKKEKTR